MPCYEHVIIARPDISTAQFDALVKEFSDVVSSGGGKIKSQEYWGLRTLAYKIKKHRKAHYQLLNIESPAPAVAEMERLERLNEDIMRTMTIRVDGFSDDPSPIMRKEKRARRDDEGGYNE